MDNLRDKQLLIISQDYSTFTKDQVECIAPSFKHVFVLPVCRPIAEISNFLPLHSMKPFRRKEKIDLSNLPENVTVLPTPLHYLPVKSWYKKVGDKHARTVFKAIDKHKIKFDLIHCHFSYSSGYVGMRLKEKYNVPLVITAHGFDIYDLPFRDDYWQKLIASILQRADRIITVSKKNIACIRKLQVNTPVDLIPNGFQSEIFFPMKTKTARKKLNLPVDRKIIVTVGNLIEIKGHTYLIDAIKNILPSHKNLLCLIVGSGGLRKTLNEQIRQSGIEENVRLLGEKDHEQINSWINSCDIFILPSLNEGNPTVLFECLGCGKPFIGSRVGGVPEIIHDEKLGLQFEPGDIKDMETVISRALNTVWDREYIIQESEEYTWDLQAKKIIDIYHRLESDG